MASGLGYTPLHNEDADANHSAGCELSSSSYVMLPEAHLSSVPGCSAIGAAHDEAPPPYISSADFELKADEDARDRPPKYADVFKLPSYHESESIEDFSDADAGDDQRARRVCCWSSITSDSTSELTEEQVGSDLGFSFAFLFSFIFNWLGFLISYCVTKSLACHYGAIAGLGLSFVKWTFIMKRSDCCREYLMSNSWLMWCLAMIGLIIFFRGSCLYIQVKRIIYIRRNGGRLLLWGY